MRETDQSEAWQNRSRANLSQGLFQPPASPEDCHELHIQYWPSVSSKQVQLPAPTRHCLCDLGGNQENMGGSSFPSCFFYSQCEALVGERWFVVFPSNTRAPWGQNGGLAQVLRYWNALWGVSRILTFAPHCTELRGLFNICLPVRVMVPSLFPLIWKHLSASCWGQLLRSQAQSISITLTIPIAFHQPLCVDLWGLRQQERQHCGFTPLSLSRQEKD